MNINNAQSVYQKRIKPVNLPKTILLLKRDYLINPISHLVKKLRDRA